MSADLSQFSREDLEELVERQHDRLDALASDLRELEALVDAHGRQLQSVRLVVAGGDEAFYHLAREDNAADHDLAGHVDEVHAALDGFAERLARIQPPEGAGDPP